LRNPIRLVLAAALVLQLAAGTAAAYSPTVAELDAEARAAGNRRDLAQQIGDSVFATEWPAEVSQISANALDDHLIVGIRVLGVKFHHPITRAEFASEIAALAGKGFAAAPAAEEIDIWASVPVGVAKGVVVSGDLARPTSRTVFSVTARRGESAAALEARLDASNGSVFWDEQWAQSAFRLPE
jgi:ABC-type amino acid transport substrate-binding protein